MEEKGLPLYFGDWVKRRRKALDLTQDELAQDAGCSVFALRKIESGERKPSKQLAGLLAKSLNLPQEEQTLFIQAARGERSVERLHLPATPISAIAPVSIKRGLSASKLPLSPNPLIGREAELTALGRLLQDPACRLLTLVGPGGIGKTRLAIEAASIYRDLFHDGVCFVPLASLSSPAFLVPAIADALGLSSPGSADLRERLLSFLESHSQQAFLLVLDNLEHLLSHDEKDSRGVDAALLIAEIMQLSSHLKLLVTSRERLNLHGEWTFEVGGLPAPLIGQSVDFENFSAVKLFLQRARQAKADLELMPEDLLAIVQICQLVEGSPLAIELAAAWTSMLSCQEIAQEIQHNLDFLAASTRNIPERHRSLKAVFEHSWKLLSAEERTSLQRLSVFRGGFTRHAAEMVVEAELAMLSELGRKSLVHFHQPGRFDLHELIRQYAEAYLQADPEEESLTRDRHSDYFIQLLVQREQSLKSARQPDVLAELSTEIDNLRAAWIWAAQHQETARLHEAAFAFMYFYELRNMLQEGETAFRQAAEGIRARQASFPAGDLSWQITLNEMLINQTYLAGRLGCCFNLEGEAVLRGCIEDLRAWGGLESLRFALRYYGLACRTLGRLDEADQSMKESLALSRERRQIWEIGITCAYCGMLAYEQGRLAEAQSYLDESLAIGDSLGDRRLRAFALAHHSRVLLALNEAEKASQQLQESLSLSQSMGDRWGAGLALLYLGRVSLVQGEKEKAQSLLESSLALFEEVNTNLDRVTALVELGRLSHGMGRDVEAKEYLAKALRIAAEQCMGMNVLSALAGFALLKARTGQAGQALIWIMTILRHPSCNYDTSVRLENLRLDLEAQLAQEQIEEAQIQAKEARPLEYMVKDILSEV